MSERDAKATKNKSNTERFARAYWLTVALLGVLSVGAIVVAIVLNVLVGLCIAVLVAVGYSYAKRLTLKHYLGLTLASAEYGLTVVSLSARGNTQYTLPSRLMGMELTALTSGALATEGNDALSVLWLSESLTQIALPTKEEAPALTTVLFSGSDESFYARLCGPLPTHLAVVFHAAMPTDGENGQEVRA